MNIVKAPATYSNSVVIVIPDQPGGIGANKVDVTIWYVTNDTGVAASIVDSQGGLISSAVSVKASMHVRGMATAQLPKKQFTVELKSEPGGGNFLGMPGNGLHWVFNDCGAMDYTLVRNPLTFQAQQQLGQYAPAYEYFELFLCNSTATVTNMQHILDNYYHGLYLNLDKIRFQTSRIDLPYDETELTSDYAIIQLNQLEKKYLAFPNITLTANVQIYEPKLKHINKAKPAGRPQQLTDDFNNWYNGSGTNWGGAFADIYNTYHSDPTSVPESEWKKVRPYTDYQSFAVYFLMNEIAKDEDGYHKSTFMVKNKQTCLAGPLWDKNKSYGNVASVGDPTYTSPDNWLFEVTGQCPVWWHVLPWDPEFCRTVWAVWEKNSKIGGVDPNAECGAAGVLTSAWMVNFVNAQVAKLTASGALSRDSQCWPNAYNTPTANYTAQVSQLTQYLEQRLAWISKNLAGMLKTKSGFVPAEK